MENRNIIRLIGLVASIITIFVFITGRNSLFCKNEKEKSKVANKEIRSDVLDDNSVTIKLNNSIFKNKGVVVKNNSKELVLLKEYSLKEVTLSPDMQKIAAIDSYFDLHIINIDGSNHIELEGKTPGSLFIPAYIRNPIWAGNNKIRLNIDFANLLNGMTMYLSRFEIAKPGIYEINIDEFNTPTKVQFK